MPKIVWDRAGEHIYETGVDHGVLYPIENGVYGKGVPWNGLTSVSETPSGAESTAQYADNIKYLNLVSTETFGATVQAFTYPPEFGACDGSAEPVPGIRIGQQTRRPFGMSYRTLIGNDLMGTDYGYQLHLIYGATVTPSERAYNTVNDSPEAINFSWTLSTTPVEVTGYKPTASLVADSTKISAANMAKLEEILYGTETTEARLPMPDEVIKLIGSSNAISLTVTAPDGSIDLFGKDASELQTNVSVGEDVISGKLLYVEDYTGFSSDISEQEGNYLALHADATLLKGDGNATITCELLGGKSGKKTLDADGLMVFRITNGAAQSVSITATSGKDSVTKVYKLTGLELVPASSLG